MGYIIKRTACSANLISIVCLILIASGVREVYGQTLYDNKLRFWIDIGLGYSKAGAGPETSPGGGWAGRAAMHLQLKKVVVSLPATLNSGGESEYRSIFGKPGDSYYDVGLLAGIAMLRGHYGQLALSTGLARTWGNEVRGKPRDEDCFIFCGNYEYEKTSPVAGLPLEFAFYSRGASRVGYSIVLHVNVNRRNSFGGLTLNVMLGSRNWENY